MISFGLDETQQLLRDTCAELAAERIRPMHRHAEAACAVPAELAAAAVELGLTTVTLPERDGGAGLDLLTRLLVEEELSWGDPAIAAGLPGPGAAGMAVLEMGSDEQISRLLAPFAEEAAAEYGALAWTDADRSEPVTATADGGEWVLTGRKSHVIHGGRARLHVVLAATDDGPQLFAVTEAVEAGPRRNTTGLHALPIADITLAAIRVPEKDRLGGGEGLLRTLGRVTAVRAARELGCARACLDYALQYGQERIAFGRAVAHFQANAFTLADMATEIDAGRWLLWRAARSLEKRSGRWKGHLAMAATHIHAVARRSADDSLQLLGGHGYIQDHPPEKWMRDVRTLSRVGLPDDLTRVWEAEAAFRTIDDADLSILLPTADGPAVLT
jgi:alkylation response protein AidB-like acyl-CoA dehydrogenase